jgi:hypothetical protein
MNLFVGLHVSQRKPEAYVLSATGSGVCGLILN